MDTDLQGSVRAAIVAVHRNATLTPVEKQRRIQMLLRGKPVEEKEEEQDTVVEEEEEEVGTPMQPLFYSGPGAGLTNVFGCAHFKRDLFLLAPCCNHWYVCRVCHDENEDHVMDRSAVEKMCCMYCMQATTIGERCTSAQCNGRLLAQYYCDVCHCHRKESDLRFWHCDRCGLCRVGSLGVEYQHCDACNLCYPVDMSVEGGHQCIKRASDSQECPVCSQTIHNSHRPVLALRCGHPMHVDCLHSMYAHGDVRTFRCPLCKQSTEDLTPLWVQIDSAVSATTMPEPQCYWTVHIGCNDCRTETAEAPFHYYGMKCSNDDCGSYNTYVIAVDKHGCEEEENSQPEEVEEEGEGRTSEEEGDDGERASQ